MLFSIALFVSLTFAPQDGAPADAQPAPPSLEAPTAYDQAWYTAKHQGVGLSAFGLGAAWVDDVDGDGWRDLVVPDLTEPLKRDAEPLRGVLFWISGRTGKLIQFWNLPLLGDDQLECLPYFARPLPDLDGDGRQELATFGRDVYAERYVEFVRVWGSKEHALLWESTDVPSWWPIGGLDTDGDYDGDGFADVLVYGQAPGLWQGGDVTGKSGIVVLSGRDGSRLFESADQACLIGALHQNTSLAQFAPDLDGDGRCELVWRVARGDGEIDIYDGDNSSALVDCVEVFDGARKELVLQVRQTASSRPFGIDVDFADVAGDERLELLVLEGMPWITRVDFHKLPIEEREARVHVFDTRQTTTITVLGIEDACASTLTAFIEVLQDPRFGPSHDPKSDGDPTYGMGWFGWSGAPLKGALDKALIFADPTMHTLVNGFVLGHSLRRNSRLWGPLSGPAEDSRDGYVYSSWHLGESFAIDPVPTPDGERLAFISSGWIQNTGELPAIWCFDPVTGQLRFITDMARVYVEAGLRDAFPEAENAPQRR